MGDLDTRTSKLLGLGILSLGHLGILIDAG